MATDGLSEPRGAVSDSAVLAEARALRLLTTTLEAGAALVTAGAVFAIGAVHSWAYVPLFYATAALALLTAARAVLARRLRRRLGRCRFAFHASGRWLVLDDEAPYGIPTWAFNLDRPLFRAGPLLLPGAVFLCWVLFQTLPLPPSLLRVLAGPLAAGGTGEWSPLTVSVPLSARGAVFVLWALTVHVVAASTLDRRESDDRFRSFLRWLGCLVALVGLVQFAARTRLVYGLFQPEESAGDLIFGPFVNRNHFATYMLLVTPIAFGRFAVAARRYNQRIGTRANMRRRLVALAGPAGLAVLYAVVPALATVGALIATTSRGALLAFAGGIALAGIGLFRRRSVPAWAVGLVFSAVALSWFGLDRVQARMERMGDDSPGRTIVWADTVQRLDERWAAGFGLNTFGSSVTRATAWDLPVGATAWREPFESTVAEVPSSGFRTPVGIPGLAWYREAHNDYLQLLAETGAIGLLIGLWAALRAVAQVRSDPWLLASISGVLLHAFVEFGLQVPAIAALFVTVAALRPRPD